MASRTAASIAIAGDIADRGLGLGRLPLPRTNDPRPAAVSMTCSRSSSRYACRDSVGIDGEVERELLDRGELLARLQDTERDGSLDLLDDLQVDRHAAARIDR